MVIPAKYIDSIKSVFQKKNTNESRDIYFGIQGVLTMEIPKLDEKDRIYVSSIVNSESFEGLKMFLRNYAAQFYITARSFRDERTHTMNMMGDEMVNLIGTLELFKHKEDSRQDDDYAL